MNKAKWINPEIPISILALKLVEEIGEVSNEITDAHMNPCDDGAYLGIPQTGGPIHPRILEELDDVEFLTDVLRARLETEPGALVRCAQKHLK